MSLDEQIEQVVNKASLSDVKISPFGEMVQYLALNVYLTAKNGKRYFTSCMSKAAYSGPEHPTDAERQVKADGLKRVLCKLLKQKMTGRQGLIYHKGYFSFKSVEEIKHWRGHVVERGISTL